MVPFLQLLLPSTATKIADDMRETAQMTLKIERHADGQTTTLRLIGYLQAEYLEALQAQIEGNGPRMVLADRKFKALFTPPRRPLASAPRRRPRRAPGAGGAHSTAERGLDKRRGMG
jgi:hypothetical protein